MKTRYAVILAALALPAVAQVNEKAFNARATTNQVTCNVIAQPISVDNPAKIVASKEKCIQELETKQHLQTMELCQKTAARKASAMLPAPIHYKSCMNELGYDVVD